MFRLANFDDDNKDDEDGLYRFLSNAISSTIIDCLDEYLENSGLYDWFYDMCFPGGFFSGLGRYVRPKGYCRNAAEADERAGYEFTLSKMKRMKEKMLDQKEFYTFDVFEERILFCMCSINAKWARTAEGRKEREPLKEKIETAKGVLKEKYGLAAGRANDYSRKMYYASAMLLKEDEDDNLIFWDNDYGFYWKDGFIKGIHHLKALEGQNAGYGYKYACAIFSDIGIKPPLMLLGTEEANRIRVEVQNEQFLKKANEFFGSIMSAKSLEDVRDRFEENDDDLPFN